jgi:hypothetical protein
MIIYATFLKNRDEEIGRLETGRLKLKATLLISDDARRYGLFRINADPFPTTGDMLEAYYTVTRGEKSEIPAYSYVRTRVDTRTTLPNQDVAGKDPFTPKALNT